MKTISSALQAHLGGELTTLAELVRITRQDGVVLGLTSHDKDLLVDGVTYFADGAFTGDKLVQNTEMKATDFDLAGYLDSEHITQADIEAGLYDHARVDMFLCNWADVAQGAVHLRRGWLGKVELSGTEYSASLRGFHDLLTRTVGETYTPECRFCLGDTRCGVDVGTYTVTGCVSAVTDRRVFRDTSRGEVKGYFDDGLLTWLDGANAGRQCEVCSWDLDNQTFTLWMPLVADVAVGDSYQVTAGCDKRYATCRNVFSNGLNYGGFPYLPGIGKILDYPDA